jgi:DNA-binding NarL/FixJ family response regulator
MQSASLESLSDSELRVLELMARGYSNAGIADDLAISRRTVEAHTSSIFRKLKVSDDPQRHRRVYGVLMFLATTETPSPE